MNMCIFERDERYTDSGMPELDWRGERAILPAGSAPIMMIGNDGITSWEAQHFSRYEVQEYLIALGIDYQYDTRQPIAQPIA